MKKSIVQFAEAGTLWMMKNSDFRFDSRQVVTSGSHVTIRKRDERGFSYTTFIGDNGTTYRVYSDWSVRKDS